MDYLMDGLELYGRAEFEGTCGERTGIRLSVGLGNRYLAVAHRFEESKPIDMSFMEESTVIRTYGDAQGDFTAQAWLYEKQINPPQ